MCIRDSNKPMYHMEQGNSGIFSPDKSPQGAMLMDMLYVRIIRMKNTKNFIKSKRRQEADLKWILFLKD